MYRGSVTQRGGEIFDVNRSNSHPRRLTTDVAAPSFHGARQIMRAASFTTTTPPERSLSSKQSSTSSLSTSPSLSSISHIWNRLISKPDSKTEDTAIPKLWTRVRSSRVFASSERLLIAAEQKASRLLIAAEQNATSQSESRELVTTRSVGVGGQTTQPVRSATTPWNSFFTHKCHETQRGTTSSKFQTYSSSHNVLQIKSGQTVTPDHPREPSPSPPTVLYTPKVKPLRVAGACTTEGGGKKTTDAHTSNFRRQHQSGLGECCIPKQLSKNSGVVNVRSIQSGKLVSSLKVVSKTCTSSSPRKDTKTQSKAITCIDGQETEKNKSSVSSGMRKKELSVGAHPINTAANEIRDKECDKENSDGSIKYRSATSPVPQEGKHFAKSHTTKEPVTTRWLSIGTGNAISAELRKRRTTIFATTENETVWDETNRQWTQSTSKTSSNRLASRSGEDANAPPPAIRAPTPCVPDERHDNISTGDEPQQESACSKKASKSKNGVFKTKPGYKWKSEGSMYSDKSHHVDTHCPFAWQRGSEQIGPEETLDTTMKDIVHELLHNEGLRHSVTQPMGLRSTVERRMELLSQHLLNRGVICVGNNGDSDSSDRSCDTSDDELSGIWRVQNSERQQHAAHSLAGRGSDRVDNESFLMTLRRRQTSAEFHRAKRFVRSNNGRFYSQPVRINYGTSSNAPVSVAGTGDIHNCCPTSTRRSTEIICGDGDRMEHNDANDSLGSPADNPVATPPTIIVHPCGEATSNCSNDPEKVDTAEKACECVETTEVTPRGISASRPDGDISCDRKKEPEQAPGNVGGNPTPRQQGTSRCIPEKCVAPQGVNRFAKASNITQGNGKNKGTHTNEAFASDRGRGVASNTKFRRDPRSDGAYF
eukprot:Selendium_serpulae@DN6038_c0_g1_i1.p1